MCGIYDCEKKEDGGLLIGEEKSNVWRKKIINSTYVYWFQGLSTSPSAIVKFGYTHRTSEPPTIYLPMHMFCRLLCVPHFSYLQACVPFNAALAVCAFRISLNTYSSSEFNSYRYHHISLDSMTHFIKQEKSLQASGSLSSISNDLPTFS